MAVDIDQLKILHYPHPALRRKADPVGEVTEEVQAVAKRMLELMHEAPGVGLAAPQVGLNWRMFVANPTGEPEDDDVYINPTLSQPSDETEVVEEGCLSLPGVDVQVRRPIEITIEATDTDGDVWDGEYTYTSDGTCEFARSSTLANRGFGSTSLTT
ncbi:MAG: peptide deformylase, partial [Phycisphaeraceae bacterium]|nr:peptide deformylase [Phycisphaeraceae bacterium]